MESGGETFEALRARVLDCRLCAGRFAATATAHVPRPVLRALPGAPVMVSGQAPGARVHASGLPFDDPSGERLRDWMGIDRETFYDVTRIAVVPMGFCFPGYDPKGSDLPPPALCARTWRGPVLEGLGRPALSLLVGGYAQAWHLGPGRVGDRVANWRAHLPHVLPLPHPSWRNTGWLRRNPWFEAEVVPWLRGRVAALIG